jgi:UDP-glucose 4-epimerase
LDDGLLDGYGIMRFLVTGGAGFIGSHLVEALAAAGHRPLVLDDLSTGRRDNLAAEIELVQGCVTDPATVARAMAEVDGVYHLAAIASVARSNEAWLATHRVNQGGTVTVLEAARHRRLPVVHASSAAVYGAATELPLAETTPTVPLTAYGADKLGGELHGRVAALVHGVPTTGLRFFNVYGPRQLPGSPYSGVISIFVDRVRRGLPLEVHGDGSQTRDFIYVGDVVRALLAAMDRASRSPAEAEALVCNVCTGMPTSVAALAERVMAAADRTVPVRHIAARVGDIPASVGDPAHAHELLGFSATTPLDLGLERLLAAIAEPSEIGR